jgi:integrase
MPRPRPPHLHRETNRHGRTVWYVREGKGPRIRIKAIYGTPEFEEAYQAALDGKSPPPAAKASRGSLEWLWMLYRQTGAWTDELSAATRKQRGNIMRKVIATGGNQPLSKITTTSIKAGVERRKPYAARHFVDTLRGMFKWAVSVQHVKSDPTTGISVKKPKTKGFPVWSEEELEIYERRWPLDTRERVMFGVYAFTGLRRGDAAILGKQHIRKTTVMIDGQPVEQSIIMLDTEKNDTRVTLPVLPELAEILAAGPLGELSIIANKRGQPMSKETIGNLFRKAVRAAGIKNRSAHGIRKAAATRAAYNGANIQTLNAIFGWKGNQMAILYTEAADRRRLAEENMAMMSKTGTSIPAPDGKVRAMAKKS